LSLIVILTGSFLGWRYFRSTPQFSLYQMLKAVEAHDYETFTQYFDVDSVVDNVISKEIKKVEEEQGVAEEVWDKLGKSFAKGLVMIVKPMLKEEVKAEIKRQIEKGDFGDAYQSPKNIVDAFAKFRKIKVQKEGKIAKVELSLKEPLALPIKGPLCFKMRQKDNYWQIFDIDFDIRKLDVWEKLGELKEEERKEEEPKKTPKLEESEKKQKETEQIKQNSSMIEGLAGISPGGGFWFAGDEGPTIFISYLNEGGEEIRNTKKMPISADVKIYAGDKDAWPSGPFARLVFSGHFSESQIEYENVGYPVPKIIIPGDQIKSDPSRDYYEGVVKVTIFTPEQGSFTGEGRVKLFPS